MGNQIFMTVLSMSVSGSLLALVLLALRPVTRRCFSKSWHYYIWLPVLLRLLLPVQGEVNLVGGWFAAAQNSALTASGQEQTAQNSATAAIYQEQPAQDDAQTASEREQTAATAAAEKDAAEGVLSADVTAPPEAAAHGAGTVSSLTRRLRPLDFLWLVWLCGALVAFLMKLNDYRNFITYLKAGSCRVEEPQALAAAEAVRMKLGLSKNILRYENPLLATPVMVGVREPFIVLPKDGVAQDKLPFVLSHEYTHYKRKDLWYKWLFQMALCIHWFNPLLYLIGRILNADCELSCDEKVIVAMGPEERRAYGNVLLDVAQGEAACRRSVLSTTLLEDKRHLKERLENIMSYKKIGILAGAAAVVFSAAAICAAFSLGAWSQRVSDARASDRITPEDAQAAGEDAPDAAGGWLSGLLADMDRYGEQTLSHIDTEGEAYRLYGNDALIAGKDNHDVWYANFWSGDGSGTVDCRGLALNGADTLLIVEAARSTDLSMQASFTVESGQFKLVSVAPDQTVTELAVSGNGYVSIPVEAGRFAIKMVGQAAKVKNLNISYRGLNTRDINAVYTSEEEEYANHCMEDIGRGSYDVEELRAAAPYMEESQVDECIIALLERGIDLGDTLTYLMTYADGDRISDWLRDAAAAGKVSLSLSEVEELTPYLNGDCLTELFLSVPERELTFPFLREMMGYLGEQDCERCVQRYLDAGNQLTYQQLRTLEPYLSEDVLERIADGMPAAR